MVAPIGVHDFKLGQSGLPAFFDEIVPDKPQIVHRHGKPRFRMEAFQAVLVHFGEAVKLHPHFPHGLGCVLQGLRHLRRPFAAVHRIDEKTLDFFKLRIRHALENVNLRAFHDRSDAPRQKLHALHCRIGALVVLPVEELHDEHFFVPPYAHIVKHPVRIRLGKHRFYAVSHLTFRQALDVVSQKSAHPRGAYTQRSFYRRADFCRGHVELLLFFNENSVYHKNLKPILCRRGILRPRIQPCQSVRKPFSEPCRGFRQRPRR